MQVVPLMFIELFCKSEFVISPDAITDPVNVGLAIVGLVLRTTLPEPVTPLLRLLAAICAPATWYCPLILTLPAPGAVSPTPMPVKS